MLVHTVSVFVAITSVISLLLITSIIGNSLVCVVLMKNRDMRTPINYLLLNLAVADIMTGAFLTPEYIVNYITIQPEGTTGAILCRLLLGGTFGWVGGAASVFTLATIAIERYCAVLHSNNSEVIKRKLKIMIFSSWMFAIIINIPGSLVLNFDKSAESCEEFWPEEWMGKANSLSWLFLTTVIPLTLMIVLYSRVVWTLWFRNDDRNNLSFQQMGVLKVRKRVTLMAVVVSTIFGICWLTDSIMYFLAFTSSYSPGDVEWGIATTMIMFNSAVNPLVYGLLNHRFRQKLKRLASCNCLSRNKIRSTNDPACVLNSRTVPLSELALRSTDQSS